MERIIPTTIEMALANKIFLLFLFEKKCSIIVNGRYGKNSSFICSHGLSFIGVIKPTTLL